jgi:hypothetical protein
VRIDNGDAVAGVDVGDDHVAQERCLAGAALAEYSHVFSSSIAVDPDLGVVAVFFCAEHHLHVCR